MNEVQRDKKMELDLLIEEIPLSPRKKVELRSLIYEYIELGKEIGRNEAK